MVDLHSHILPAVDDGAADWETSLEMARIAVADGICTLVATPHWPGTDEDASRAENVRELTHALQARLEEEKIPLRVLPGHELVILPELPEELARGGALPLGDPPFLCSDERRRAATYALLEMPYQPLPFFLRDIIFQVQSRGITPVLAHPERNPTVQTRPETLGDYVDAGCVVQISAGSILGQFGPNCRRAALEIMRHGWMHVIASDAHSARSRPPRLAEARDAAARVVGEELAVRSVDAVPAAILAGESLDLRFEPEMLPRANFLQRLFGRA
jgi:protein-tyrosine phosphatase